MTTQEADAKCSELFKLMKPHVATNVMQRVNLFVVQKSGKKLPEFIATAEPDVKAPLIDELIGIVTKGEWDKLPVVPNGQASTNGHKPASIANQPRIPVVPVVPVVPPAPVVVTPPPAPVTPPADEPTVPEVDNAFEEEVSDDPMAIIAAQLAKLTKPAKPALTEADMRRIVRSELAVVFKTMSDVFSKK